MARVNLEDVVSALIIASIVGVGVWDLTGRPSPSKWFSSSSSLEVGRGSSGDSDSGSGTSGEGNQTQYPPIIEGEVVRYQDPNTLQDREHRMDYVRIGDSTSNRYKLSVPLGWLPYLSGNSFLLPVESVEWGSRLDIIDLPRSHDLQGEEIGMFADEYHLERINKPDSLVYTLKEGNSFK